MKSYLELIPISAKVRKRQNRMTMLCIVFSVFLVTSVFSMAEMDIKMEESRLRAKHGFLSIGDILNSGMGRSMIPIAVILFFLILLAGVLMISSSINSNVAQRIKFFGMMRCIGMSKQQITRFVRLEALNWCKVAVPVGVVSGVAASWILCAVLHYIVGEEFAHIPVFDVSLIGIASGIVMGVVTVLLAARKPAKRASKVSPVSAVSGNAENEAGIRHAVNTRVFKIEAALGFGHAVSAKKNLLLMTGSFSLSIILFLCFYVLIDFLGYLLPQSSAVADLEILSSDSLNSIDSGIIRTIDGIDGVEEVFGRRRFLDVPAKVSWEDVDSGGIDIISYDDFDLECLVKDDMLVHGSDISKVYGDSKYVLAVWDKYSPWKIGDKIWVGEEEFEIAGLLKYNPFNSSGAADKTVTLITSGQTFYRLTGEDGYALVMIQTDGRADDVTVEAVRRAAKEKGTVQDRRDSSTRGTYLAFTFCVYAFLAIIMLVALLNIINSISMSVSSRMKQYGAMRAVGMSERQIIGMIAVEASVYAVSGCAVGCAGGLLLSGAMYEILIASHFVYAAWYFPVMPLLVIVLFILFSVFAAVCVPSKRIRRMSVTETINEL